ncbi:P450-derived glycosyltransferase activator [Micromonospora sp. HNM0581]|uniref:cytochrome P450 family protein n=1 Tax=Micromonospora sp. HNM0581 TaxID=2716341 RepID=UPI00146ADF69|nr:P450-derived glycosyltransferase activator [Micromonospora sp. HNM0581]NLU80868.1 P450-derived glycosyltransferase activator [Micromonospora sp. HNM0581]
MTATSTDDALGSTLMTLRGFQWVYGARQDPYALLLRAESDDPHELGRRVRANGALTWSSAEAWVTATHALAVRLLRDERLGLRKPPPTDSAPSWAMPTLDDVLPLDDVGLQLDRTDCERFGRSVAAALAAPRLRKAHTEITVRIDRLAAGLNGAFDLTSDYAVSVATMATSVLLGVPAAHQEEFARLCAGAATALDATLCPPRLDTARLLLDSIAGLRELLVSLPTGAGDDLLGELTRTEPDSVLPVALLHCAVGADLTATLVANTMSVLLAEPGRWTAVATEPGLAAAAVRETLRFAPPVRLQRLVARTDLDLDGTAVTAGSEVVVLLEAANRDPAAFADPDHFDPGREPAAEILWAHPAMPAGVVAETVRRHATVAVSALAAHLPTLRAAGEGYRRLRSPVTGSPLSRPVVA